VTIAFWEPEREQLPFVASESGVALRVDDVAAARTELEAKGVSFVAETWDSGVCHFAAFRDPDGNVLILHRRYAPSEQPQAQPARSSLVPEKKEATMGDRTQRLKGKANEVAGKAKAKTGEKTGDNSTQAKGKAQELKGKTQQAAGKASSAVKKATR
jgi:uncharacterized protein YjbJ (UPF0337 family)